MCGVCHELTLLRTANPGSLTQHGSTGLLPHVLLFYCSGWLAVLQAVQPRITSEWAKYCYYVHKVCGLTLCDTRQLSTTAVQEEACLRAVGASRVPRHTAQHYKHCWQAALHLTGSRALTPLHSTPLQTTTKPCCLPICLPATLPACRCLQMGCTTSTST